MDVYYLDKRLETTLKRVKNGSRNKDTLIDFHRFCVAQGLSKGRIERLLGIMMTIESFMEKSFEEAKRKDLVNVLFQIENNGYSDWSKAMLKSGIKKFWRWLKETEDYPKEVNWFKINKVRTNIDEILTKEDVEAMIEAGENIMEKAMVGVLYESGVRPSEMLSLRLKDVRFDEHGSILFVSGKTGRRRIRIVEYASLLKKWIREHPMDSNSSSVVWIGQATKNRDRPMSYYSFYNTLKKIVKRSGVKKEVNPYLFRHTRATHLANHLTEAQMCHFFGWVQGSEMPRIYVHLSGKDLDEAILKIYGIKIS